MYAQVIEEEIVQIVNEQSLRELYPSTHFPSPILQAHLEGFGSVEGVTKTKKELYDYIKTQSGTIFINKNDELLQRISSDINKVEYSTQENENGSPFASVTHSGEVISTKLTGSYNCTNIQAAISIGNYFGVTPLVEIITLPRRRQNSSYTSMIMLLCCLMFLPLQ